MEKILFLPSHALYHARTLYLFTKADIKVIVLPVTCLAAASAPLASLSRLPHVIFWIWLQTLQLNLSNQTLNPEEDMMNKPDRPLPSGRMSLRTAQILRYILPFVCWAWSASYSKALLYSSIVNCIIVVIYDEMGYAAGHWFARNVLNAVGHASAEVGACLLAGKDVTALDPISSISIFCSAGIILCTIQAQDFKDAIGDAAVGRRTLPIVHPKLARPTLMILIVAWSVAVSIIWGLDTMTALPFTIFGSLIGWLFLTNTSTEADKKHLFLYLIWLSLAHALPAYSRFFVKPLPNIGSALRFGI